MAKNPQQGSVYKTCMMRAIEVFMKNRVSCLGRVTPGVKDTPFLGSARGAKEAKDLLTRSEFVGGE